MTAGKNPPNRTPITGDDETLYTATVDSATRELPTLATDALAHIHEAVGEDNRNLVIELLDLFLQESQALVEKTMQAAAERNDRALFIAVHSLRSSSATFGAPRLAALCAALETALSEADGPIDVSVFANEIAAEHANVVPAFEQMRAQLGGD